MIPPPLPPSSPSSPELERRLGELERAHAEGKRSATDPMLAMSLSLSLLLSQLVEELLKSRPVQYAMIAIILSGSVVAARRRRASP